MKRWKCSATVCNCAILFTWTMRSKHFLSQDRPKRPPSRSYNAGGLDTLSLKQIAETVSSVGGLPEPRIVPFPPDRKPIDIGSYRTDNRRIQRELGWKPKVRFAEGIRLTRDFSNQISATI